jgi:hypothetical protein
MGVDSLKMDIEMYADLLTYTKDDIENYYMDTREITFDQFLEIAPYIGAGIMRNYIQSDFELGYKEDVRRQVPDKTEKTESGEEKTVKTELDKFASNMKTSITNKESVEPVIDKPFLHFIKLVFEDAKQNSVLEALFGNDAIDIVNGYLSLDYNNGRAEYYELVKAAENTFSKFLKDTNKETVFALMKQTSHALVYRAESYVFSNTVMDVVRGFQAEEYELISRNSGLCNTNTNQYAPCIIGPYGYVISLLENIGYIYRFYRTYCVEGHHINQVKCNNKNRKYIKRVTISFAKLAETITSLQNGRDIFKPTINYNEYITGLKVTTEGGKRRRRTRRRRSTIRRRKNTRRYRRKSSRR